MLFACFIVCPATSLPALPPSLPPSLPLCGKHEVSIIVPLFFQCDSAWWLPLTGLSWLPHTFGSCACRSNIFPVTFPNSSIVDEFNKRINKHLKEGDSFILDVTEQGRVHTKTFTSASQKELDRLSILTTFIFF